MKNLLSLTVCMIFGVSTIFAGINPQPSHLKVCGGTLENLTIYSPELQRDVQIDVLLPEGYNATTKHPVIYMHDGQNLFDANFVWNKQAWEMDEAVDQYDGLKPIIVGVYSVQESRFGDLMPTDIVEMLNPNLAAIMLQRMNGVEIKGDKYVDFLANTLKPEIDSHYSTLQSPEYTYVMGSSMGGLASLYALCRHPETFGGAGCLSTHFITTFEDNEIFPTAFAAYLLKNLPMDGNHRIYFDTGDQTIDANYEPSFSRIMKMIEEMGMPSELFMYRKFPGDAHEENSWARRVHIPLSFLLKAN